MKSTRRTYILFLAVSLGFMLCWAGCGSDDNELRIIIEDGSGTTAPAPDTAGPSPAPEPGTTPGPGGTPPPEPPTREAREMNMDALEVVSMVASSPEFGEDEILKVLPKMTIGNRPHNALWEVRLMIRDIIIAEYVIDDTSQTIVTTETYFDRVRDVLREHREGEITRHLETSSDPTLGYDGALTAAMTSPSFPELDTSREFWVTIVYIRFERVPAWHVSVGYKDSEDVTHISIDDSGAVIDETDVP